MVNPRQKGSRDLWSGGDELLGSSPPGEDLQEWAKDEKLKQIKTNIEISQSPSPGIVVTTCSKLESPLADSDSPPLCPLSLPSVSARAPRRAITLFCSRARLAFTWVLLVSGFSIIDHAFFVSCLIRYLYFISYALTGESFLHLHLERVLTEAVKPLQGVLRYYDESCQKPTKMAFCGDDGEPDICSVVLHHKYLHSKYLGAKQSGKSKLTA